TGPHLGRLDARLGFLHGDALLIRSLGGLFDGDVLRFEICLGCFEGDLGGFITVASSVVLEPGSDAGFDELRVPFELTLRRVEIYLSPVNTCLQGDSLLPGRSDRSLCD